MNGGFDLDKFSPLKACLVPTTITPFKNASITFNLVPGASFKGRIVQIDFFK